MFNAIGLGRGIGQYIGVILVLAISATSVFLLRQYFMTIPKDIEEAARIDGAGFFHDVPSGDAAPRWARRSRR